VSIFLNTSNGTFSDPVVYESGGNVPTSIATGDFNGDGKLDIAVLQYDSSSNQNLVGILLGNGDGTFQPVITTPTGSANALSWLAAADFNGDGRTDLVAGESTYNGDPSAGATQILLSNGDGTFTFGQTYGAGGRGSASVATGDVNADGKPDIVIASLCDPITGDANCQRGAIETLLGNGDGTFTPGATQVIPDGNFFSVSLADVNADGKLDAIASTETGVAVFIGNGDGTLQPPSVYAALLVTQNSQLAISDLNGDLGLDIVQPGVNGQLAVLYSQGFSTPLPVFAPTSLTFAKQVVGTTSASKTVTLTNAGSAALNISSITATSDFAVLSSTCGSALAVGKKCKVKVTFTPSALGTLNGQLIFTDNAVPPTQSLPLTGTGVSAADLSPASASYPARIVGTTSPPKTFTLANNQAVTLTSIAISTTGDFQVSATTCGSSLAAKSKCKISITFTPTAKGPRSGQLSVSDSASNSPQVSGLTGTGK